MGKVEGKSTVCAKKDMEIRNHPYIRVYMNINVAFLVYQTN